MSSMKWHCRLAKAGYSDYMGSEVTPTDHAFSGMGDDIRVALGAVCSRAQIIDADQHNSSFWVVDGRNVSMQQAPLQMGYLITCKVSGLVFHVYGKSLVMYDKRHANKSASVLTPDCQDFRSILAAKVLIKNHRVSNTPCAHPAKNTAA